MKVKLKVSKSCFLPFYYCGLLANIKMQIGTPKPYPKASVNLVPKGPSWPSSLKRIRTKFISQNFQYWTHQRKFKKCVKNVKIFQISLLHTRPVRENSKSASKTYKFSKFHFYTLDPSEKIQKVRQKRKNFQILLLHPRHVRGNSKSPSKT